MGKKFVITMTAEIELKDDWYDNPLETYTDEQLIETEKDDVHKWFFDYVKIEDWKVVNTKD